MFKLVETVENNEKNFTAVPASWEAEGLLYWPQNLKSYEREKLRKNNLSSPDPNWSVLKCEVKAMVRTFTEGLHLEKLYTSFTDTESEERYIKMKKSNNKRAVKSRKLSSPKDYNCLFEENLILNGTEVEFSANENVMQPDIFTNNILQEITVCNNETLGKETSANIVCSENVNCGANNITENNLLLSIFEEMKAIKTELAALSVKLDKLLEKQSEHSQDDFKLDLTSNIELPLKTIEDMYMLNNNLSSQDYRKEMIARLTSVGGTNKVSDGCKIMYKIVDFLFTPELINKFSWTGSSKNSGKKECFQKLTNIVDVIYELVFLADCRHSRHRNEQYLKEKILKHTSQRLNRKRKLEVPQERIPNSTEGQTINMTI